MDIEILRGVAKATVDVGPSFDGHATYHGAKIPLHGIARIRTTAARLSAEIDDVENWQSRVIATFPKGTMIPAGSLFREVTPGRLIGEEGHGEILPDDGPWAAHGAFYNGESSHYGVGAPNVTTFKFSISSLEIHGPSKGAPVAATRWIYAGGEWNHETLFEDRVVVIRALSDNASKIEDERLAITIEGAADDISERAVWLFASFISGNRLGGLLTEYYADDGSLIRQIHRRGYVETERHRFWRPFYASFSADGMQSALHGLAERLRQGFPIDVVMEHMFLAATGDIDVDAIHLTLAAHTAIEAWNRKHGFESWIDRRPWTRFADHILDDLIPQELYESVGDDVKSNIWSALINANRTTTAWRQAQLYAALGIDVSGSDAQRVVKMRNELLHNGYFLKRWSELSPEEAQQRRDDVERLRRLALFIVLRLIGYHGSYLDPVTFQVHNMPAQAEGNVAP